MSSERMMRLPKTDRLFTPNASSVCSEQTIRFATLHRPECQGFSPKPQRFSRQMPAISPAET
ncbi:hypothetical protein [Bacteroides sp.]|uniref:hypothetical protein n=1 Tax=Bacteroides sp. TaxID=29523 RepID=UPI00261BE57A|nr:hypothetical protein [Bacteroides sp.]